MPTIPYRVSSFSPWDANPDTGINVVTFAATYISSVIRASSIRPTPGANVYYYQDYQLDGTPIGSLVSQSPAIAHFGSVRNLNSYWGTPDASNFYWANLVANVITQGVDITATVTGTTPAALQGSANIYQNGKIYGIGAAGLNPQAIGRYNAPGRVPGTYDGVFGNFDSNYAGILLGVSDTNDVYAMQFPGGGLTQMWKFDADLNLLHHWTTADCAGTRLANNANMWNFAVQNNMVVFNATTAPSGGIYAACLVAIDPVTFALTDVGVPLTHTNSPIIGLGGCLFLDRDGVFSVCNKQPIIWTSL